MGALRLLAALRGLWVDAEVEGLLTQVLALAQAQVQRQQGRPGRRGTPGRRTAAEKQQQVQQQEEEGGGGWGATRAVGEPGWGGGARARVGCVAPAVLLPVTWLCCSRVVPG